MRGKYTAADQRTGSRQVTTARIRSERKGLTDFPPSGYTRISARTRRLRLDCESCHHRAPHSPASPASYISLPLSLSRVRIARSAARRVSAAGLIRHPSLPRCAHAHLIDLGCWLTSGHPPTESPVAKILTDLIIDAHPHTHSTPPRTRIILLLAPSILTFIVSPSVRSFPSHSNQTKRSGSHPSSSKTKKTPNMEWKE